jgi:hypothetical protein
MVIMPPHMQVQVEELFKAGMPPSMTVAEPGAQGATVFGIQGMGVNTPKAAAVADATVGLASDMHTPNVGMFTMGLLSMMLAAGVPIIVLLVGSTLRALGAAPKLHIIIEPAVTNSGIAKPVRMLCCDSAISAWQNQGFFSEILRTGCLPSRLDRAALFGLVFLSRKTKHGGHAQ